MQVAANHKLVRNRGRLAVGLYVVSLVILGLGYLRSYQQRETEVDLVATWAPTYAFIVIGVLVWAIGLSQLNRWGPRRQQDVLTKEIRSLDDRYKLYSFISSSLPDYILIGPAGVQILLMRPQSGTISCQQNRWRTQGTGAALLRFFGGGNLGNPTADGLKQIARVKALLETEGLGDVPVTAAVVFTHPKARLEVRGCAIGVTRLDQARTFFRRTAGKGREVAMNTPRLRALQSFFDRRMESASSWR